MLKQRIITAIIGIPLLIIVVWFEPRVFTVAIVLIAALAGKEFYTIAEHTNIRPLSYTGLIFIAILIISYIFQPLSKIVIIFIGLICTAIMVLLNNNTPNRFHTWIWTNIGIIYIGFLLSYWTDLRNLTDGKWWVFWTIGVIMSCDIAAYFSGKKWGKHHLAPQVSPNKTWEGAISGTLTGTIVGIVLAFIFPLNLSLWLIIILSFVITILAQIGDLLESTMKRSIGIKDTGNFFPGHGGVLDRIDSYMFTGAFIYLFLNFFSLYYVN